MRGGLAGIQAALEGQSVAVAEKCHFLCKTWLPSEGINLKPSLLDPEGSRSPLGDETLPLVRVERSGRAQRHGALQEQPWLHCTGFLPIPKKPPSLSTHLHAWLCTPAPGGFEQPPECAPASIHPSSHPFSNTSWAAASLPHAWKSSQAGGCLPPPCSIPCSKATFCRLSQANLALGKTLGVPRGVPLPGTARRLEQKAESEPGLQSTAPGSRTGNRGSEISEAHSWNPHP